MWRLKSAAARRLLLLSTLLAAPTAANSANLVLITPEEARLPPEHAPIMLAQRGVTRAPSIDVVLPPDASHSPFHLQMKFQAHGGARIDPTSVQATYLRLPNVDLTQRIKPYLTEGGIDVPAAEVPPGEHAVRVDVSDSEGHRASTSFVLKIGP